MFPMGVQTRPRNPRRNRVSTQVQSWTSFTPLSLAPVLWLDAADTSTITSSSGAVSQWNDKSGNGLNVTQATGSAQPGTGAVTQNGLNVLTFDGGDRLAAATASDWKFMHDGTRYFVSAVLQPGIVANPNTLYGFLGTVGADERHVGVAFTYEDRTIVSANNAARVDMFRGVIDSYVISTINSDLMTANTFSVVSFLMDPSNATASQRTSVRSNGSAETRTNTFTGTVSTANPTFALRVGSWADGSYSFIGRIAEIVIVRDTYATDLHRQALRDYLNAKWAVY